MRATQLKYYYTQKPAPEADRIRIQARIDEFREKIKELYTKADLVMIGSFEHSIMVLQGKLPPVRG